LNAGLLIHTEHQRVLGRVQIEPNHISRFAAELRIGAYTPALPASQTQMVLSHYPPDLILAHLAQMLGKQSPVPAAVAAPSRASNPNLTHITSWSRNLHVKPLHDSECSDHVPFFSPSSPILGEVALAKPTVKQKLAPNSVNSGFKCFKFVVSN
jgi:hypothetical protein